MINVNITNELARIVGLIADKHKPDFSVQIEWREGTPEEEWIVTATNGTEDFVYVCDDEQGIWAPATERDLQTIDAGLSVFEDMDRRLHEAGYKP